MLLKGERGEWWQVSCASVSTHLQSMSFLCPPLVNTKGFNSGKFSDEKRFAVFTPYKGDRCSSWANRTSQAFIYKDLKGLKDDSKSCWSIYLIATIITWFQFKLAENKEALRPCGHRMLQKEAICVMFTW